MKKIIIMAISLIFASSCDITKTSVSGIENQAFLLIVGTPSNYPDGVEVTLNDKTKFIGEVQKDYMRVKDVRLYGISTGKHDVSIMHNNQLLYKKTIFVSSQQTKKIILP
tara:strand:+ start:100 stop:429 length:330 start_codon:yes stop_codon:yes gene_type:complete